MPTVTLNKTVFEELVGKKLPLEELKDRISLLGTDLEGIEGDEINVEVFPCRPDMLSEQGFARAFASFIGVRPGIKNYDVEESDAKVIIDNSVSKVRPYTACALVKGLSFDDERIREVIQIQEKLHVTFGRNRKKAAIGIYPLEHITLPITYTAKKPEEIRFRPLESQIEMDGLQILEQHPTGKAYAKLLEGQSVFPVFIDGAGEILSMPPIINSHKTGRITEDTKDVFIECSGHDFKTLSICLNMIVTAMSDMGGKIISMNLEYPDGKIKTPDLTPSELELDLGYANKMLGTELTLSQATELLRRMGHEVKLGKKVMVQTPGYRSDILHQVDLIEDIAIAYGYDNFEESIPKIASTASESAIHKISSKLAQILIGMGFLEAVNYHLTSDEVQSHKMTCESDTVTLSSAVNVEYNVLRSWILPGLLQVLGRNKHYEYPQRLFEIGTVFFHDNKTETGVGEQDKLCAINAHQTADFTEARQQLDALMKTLDLKYQIKEQDYPFYIPGRSAKILFDGKEVGHIGEIHPQVLENFELAVPVSGFEIKIKEIMELLLL